MSDIAYGILNLNSKITYGKIKNFVLKKFTNVLDNKTYNIKTKHAYSSSDIYVIANTSTMSVIEYIGNVGDYESECKFLESIATTVHRKKIKPGTYIYKDAYANSRQELKELIYTVDPPNCVDIDDALHAKKLDNGHIEIGIHIADVSAYLDIGDSGLETELFNRTETIYFKNKQFNMLPDDLCKICSLTENTKKAAHSLIIELDTKCDDGGINIVSTKFVHTLITVARNFNYDNATDIKLLYDTGKQLYRGGDVYDTHKMVETYMVLCNTIVAKHISKKYPDKVILRISCGDYTKNSKNEAERYANILLQNSAKYVIGTKDNKGHSGLGELYYTHFTSPIRRYIDILTHRMIDNIDHKYTDRDIDKINEKNKLYKAIGRKLNTLDKIYDIHMYHDNILNIQGSVIGIAENRLSIYIPEYGIITTKIFSNKLGEILSCSSDKDSISIINTHTHENIKICMFQKITIKIITVINRVRKMYVDIIDPNIKSISDESPDSYYYSACGAHDVTDFMDDCVFYNL